MKVLHALRFRSGCTKITESLLNLLKLIKLSSQTLLILLLQSHKEQHSQNALVVTDSDKHFFAF